MKNFGEKGGWAYPETSIFFEYPISSQECIKLQTSNLAGIFTGTPSKQKPFKNLGEKGAGRIQRLPKFLEYPVFSQKWVKLRTSNLAGIFTGSIRTKAP